MGGHEAPCHEGCRRGGTSDEGHEGHEEGNEAPCHEGRRGGGAGDEGHESHEGYEGHEESHEGHESHEGYEGNEEVNGGSASICCSSAMDMMLSCRSCGGVPRRARVYNH